MGSGTSSCFPASFSTLFLAQDACWLPRAAFRTSVFPHLYLRGLKATLQLSPLRTHFEPFPETLQWEGESVVPLILQ